jgi:AraC family transcriptional regulator
LKVTHPTAISRALDFVEDNLKQEITVADMANAAGYSLYHFSRTFNGMVHHTPYDYLMRRRLSESARDLVETDGRIIDIAFDYGFNSPETFSRAFKRMFDVQPHQWRKREWIDERLLMPRLTLEHIEHINKGEYLRPVLWEKDAFSVTGVMSLVRNGREAVAQLWEMLSRQLTGLNGDNGNQFGDHYGIAWYPEDWGERGFFYMAAVEVISGGGVAADALPSALVDKTIPPSTYAKFVHKGSREELQFTLDYVYQIWLPKSGESLAHPYEIECYGKELEAAQAGAGWEVLVPIERE